MKPRRIFSALLLSLGLILLTFAATCRLVMTNIQIDYDPSSPATVTLTVFGQSDEYAMAIDAVAICGDCTEYGEGACCSFDDLINDKGYAYPIEDYKADNDIETDDEFDQDDYIVALVKKLEQRTTVLHVSNGNYIIFA